MKKIRWLFSLLFSASLFVNALAQTNMIPNPGFENITPDGPYSGPGFDDEDFPCEPTYCLSQGTRNGIQNDYWATVYAWTLPFHNINSSIFRVGSSDLKCEVSHSGSNSGYQQLLGQSQCEYLVAPLVSSLQPFRYYYFEIWMYSLSAETIPAGDYGWAFYSDHPEQAGVKQIASGVPYMYDLYQWHDVINIPAQEWTKIYGIYQNNTPGTFDYINVGSFEWFQGTSSMGFYVDDLIMYDLGTDACPDDWLIENEEYNSIEFIRQADQTIRAGFNVGHPTEDGEVIVQSGGVMDYKAGEMVRLEPGFEVRSGGRFHAYIEACGTPGNSAGRPAGDQLASLDHVLIPDPVSELPQGPSDQQTEAVVGMTSSQQGQGWSIYPNPTSDHVMVRATDANLNRVRLLDLTGRVVMDLGNMPAGRTHEVSLTSLSKGVYRIQCEVQGILQSKPLVVE